MAHESIRKVLTLARKLGVPPAGLRRLARGQLERIGRGLHAAPTAKISAHRSLAEVSKAAPQGVVCLLSALRYHGLTTQHPSEVRLALLSKAWRPRRAHASPRARGVFSRRRASRRDRGAPFTRRAN